MVLLGNNQPPTEYHAHALSPAAQEAREKKAILEDPRLQYLIGDEKVLDICKESGGYRIITESMDEWFVGVEYIRGEHFCGPAQFYLIFPLKVKEGLRPKT